jgi:hypothetical protein
LKSTDGGASWILLGSGIPTGNTGNAKALFTGLNISTIIVDPADRNVLYLAAGRVGDHFGGIAPGNHATFTVRFSPSSSGAQSAVIRIATNDPAAPFVDVLATGMLETTPPTISALTATPDVLFPPNHKMVPITLAVTVTDNCDAAVANSCHIVSILSSEPVTAPGDQTAPDWETTGALTANLRAERSGAGVGRAYTVTIQCTDNAGNSATRAVKVAVPHP